MIQLSAGINAAYFTFKGANEPFYQKHTGLFREISDARKELRDAHRDTITDINRCLDDYRNFLNKPPLSWDQLDHILFYCGYAVFVACVVFIGWSTVCKTCSADKQTMLLIFLVAYAPILASLLIETISRRKFDKIQNSATAARRKALSQITHDSMPVTGDENDKV